MAECNTPYSGCQPCSCGNHSSDVADDIKGWGKNGVVGVGTWYKLNVAGYESQQGKEIFSYTVFNL